MANDKAFYSDDIWFLMILLSFLIINWNMPMASIYSTLANVAMWGYMLPILLGLFSWIPLSKKDNRMAEIIAGVVAAVGFIWFYKKLTATPMAAIFATTAFGDSTSLHNIVFGALIPTIETVFFFVILPLWALWKMGKSFSNNLFSGDNIITMIAFAMIFTVFHATSKGLAATNEWAATWVFGVVSIGLIIFFGSVLSALLMHILVNSYSLGLLDLVKVSMFSSSPIIMVIAAVVIIYLVSSKRIRLPFIG